VTLRPTADSTQRIRVPPGQRVTNISSGGTDVPFTRRDGAVEVTLRAGRTYQLTFGPDGADGV
jgi:hypothetical protein